MHRCGDVDVVFHFGCDMDNIAMYCRKGLTLTCCGCISERGLCVMEVNQYELKYGEYGDCCRDAQRRVRSASEFCDRRARCVSQYCELWHATLSSREDMSWAEGVQ